jgi:hypothetical protein
MALTEVRKEKKRKEMPSALYYGRHAFKEKNRPGSSISHL